MYEEIRQLKEDPLKPYMEMCREFMGYRNAQCALVIMQNLIVKGHNLNEAQL